jgi:Tol biopolymer transport system component
MKYFFFLFISAISFAQSNTEVYLYELSLENDRYYVKSGKNISNNPGYDSQPHFYSKKSIIFASTRGKQTDIAKYNLESGKIKYLSDTPKGGEYSPQRIPKSKDVSAVRLDDDGLQRFYKYDSKSGKSKELIADLKVAYPFWLKKNVAINVVIVDKNLDLIISNLKNKTNSTIQKKVGRSVHKIPNTEFVSYISKANDQWEVMLYNTKNGDRKKIINTIGNKEDVCWLPNGTLLMAVGNTIMKFNPATDSEWSVFHAFSKTKHQNISRIIVNKKGTYLAIVSE